MIRRVALAVVLVAAVLGRPLSAASLLVAFKTAREGGLVRIALDEEARPSEPVVIFRDPAFAAASKLRVSPDGRRATLNAETEGRPNFALVDLAGGTAPAAVRLLTLDFTPEEHRLADDRACVGGSDGHVVVLDPATGEIMRRWDSRRQLSPAGHKPEDLLALEPEDRLLVSHQKDGKKGRLGGRLVVLRLADLSLVGDLRLPRDHPGLHLSEKEAGPSPEVLRADRATNTLLVTLDLYGALAFADLDAALAGRLENYATLPTSADGSPGTAFPDRVALAQANGRSLAVVANASATHGGLAVFDVARRRQIAFYPVEAGCAEPVPVNEGRTLATVIAGKCKRVSGDGLASDTAPGSDLLLLDLERASDGAADALRRVPLGSPTAQIEAVSGHPGVVAVTDLGDPARLLICSVEDGRILSSTTLPGLPVSLRSVP